MIITVIATIIIITFTIAVIIMTKKIIIIIIAGTLSGTETVAKRKQQTAITNKRINKNYNRETT